MCAIFKRKMGRKFHERFQWPVNYSRDRSIPKSECDLTDLYSVADGSRYFPRICPIFVRDAWWSHSIRMLIILKRAAALMFVDKSY